MKTYLKNNFNGEEIEVTSTTNHPESSYGKAVWVDKEGNAYCQVGIEAPFYTVFNRPDRTRQVQYRYRHPV